MATSSKKTTTTPGASTTSSKKPAAKKVSSPKTKTSASKPATTAKSALQKRVKKNTVTPEERYRMIATAAYFRAEQHGFTGGCEMEDWISGEAEIDVMLNA